MIILSTFLESLSNFLSNNLKKHDKIRYSQKEKRCQNLNCQKHSLKGQLGIKSTIKSTWSKKMILLSTFLESLSKFLYNNLKKHYKIRYSQRRKTVSKFQVSDPQFERTVMHKIACKPHLE